MCVYVYISQNKLTAKRIREWLYPSCSHLLPSLKNFFNQFTFRMDNQNSDHGVGTIISEAIFFFLYFYGM